MSDCAKIDCIRKMKVGSLKNMQAGKFSSLASTSKVIYLIFGHMPTDTSIRPEEIQN
jgi:hypothetical protein